MGQESGGLRSKSLPRGTSVTEGALQLIEACAEVIGKMDKESLMWLVCEALERRFGLASDQENEKSGKILGKLGLSTTKEISHAVDYYLCSKSMFPESGFRTSSRDYQWRPLLTELWDDAQKGEVEDEC